MKKYSQILTLKLLGVFFFISNIQAQQLDNLKTILASQQLLEVTQKSDSLLQQISSQKTDSLSYLYQEIALWHFKARRNKSALHAQQKAFETLQGKALVDSSFLQKAHLYLGLFLRKNNYVFASINSYSKSLEYPKSINFQINALDNLGGLYRKTHDYEQAIIYRQKLIDIVESSPRISKINVTAHLNMAALLTDYRSESGFTQGIYHAQKADSLSRFIKVSTITKYKIQLCLGQLYNQYETLDIPIAKKHFTNALDIAKKLQDSNKIRSCYFLMGNLHNSTDFSKSMAFFEEAKKYTSPIDSVNLGRLYDNIGFVHSAFGKYKNAISHLETGITYLSDRNTTNIDRQHLFGNTESKKTISLMASFPTIAVTYLKYYEENLDTQNL